MQLRRRWQACGWLLVFLALILWMAMAARRPVTGEGRHPNYTPPPDDPAHNGGGDHASHRRRFTHRRWDKFYDRHSYFGQLSREPPPDGINVTFTTDKGRFTPKEPKSPPPPLVPEPALSSCHSSANYRCGRHRPLVASADGVASSTHIALG